MAQDAPRESMTRMINGLVRDHGPAIVEQTIVRARLGDWDAIKLLMPVILPKPKYSGITLSSAFDIDVTTTEAAKASLARVLSAIGNQEIGLEEGERAAAVIGQAIERMAAADINLIIDRIDHLEQESKTRTAPQAGRQPTSRANGHTPAWGNVRKLEAVDGGKT